MRIVLLPGLAADARLFAPQLAEFPEAIVPAWIPPRRGEALETYARRMALMIQQDEGPYWLGGFSFGGQVAQELVQHLRRPPKGLILFSGVRGRWQIRRHFVLQQRVSRFIPMTVQQLGFVPYARWFGWRNGLSRQHARILVDMARDIDPIFLRWSSRVCAEWKGEPNLRGLPIVHVHGERDRIIPDVRREATHTIAGAGHLITLSHAGQVNAIIREVVRPESSTRANPSRA